ncbi:hypothetical protein NQ036_10390 [Brevibacterium sp. 91QC2O2]|uniref:hypothetical protein n=1 Tax=Brevibacterium sp. 91QC2O2 TaxID=2968458 RepID=UPI00211CC3D0|nr:hypothetical protein [Brevibacterium sp. 91QC2O2]MCQ9368644.1 hypothetical protein [Brevibacterium sp. 91QC2O2]
MARYPQQELNRRREEILPHLLSLASRVVNAAEIEPLEEVAACDSSAAAISGAIDIILEHNLQIPQALIDQLREIADLAYFDDEAIADLNDLEAAQRKLVTPQSE